MDWPSWMLSLNESKTKNAKRIVGKAAVQAKVVAFRPAQAVECGYALAA
jgi:hypothetical protein